MVISRYRGWISVLRNKDTSAMYADTPIDRISGLDVESPDEQTDSCLLVGVRLLQAGAILAKWF